MPTNHDDELSVAPRVPRRIIHTVDVNASTFVSGSALLTNWSSLNPEYDWHIFDDADCNSFMDAVATPQQRWAYQSLATGAARSDLFRVIVLLYLGGVYADVDVELRRPLRTVLPPNASMVMSPRVSTEWLMMEAGHPLLRVLAKSIVTNVQRQVDLWRADSPAKCSGIHGCVIGVTGPERFLLSFVLCARSLGCAVSLTYYPHFISCANSSSEAMRASRRCVDEELVNRPHWRAAELPHMVRGWDCGIAMHRHCVTNKKKGHWECSGADRRAGHPHYTDSRATFFRLDAPNVTRLGVRTL